MVVSAQPAILEGTILDAVIRSSLDCIIVVDEESCVLEFNPAAEQTFGHERAYALGKPIGDLIVPEHLRAAHTAGFQRYLAGGDPHVLGRRVEIEGARADGSVFPVELTITEVPVGERRLFTASLRDLSERRAAEAALRASEARFASFFDAVPTTMYLKGADDRYLMANAEMASRLGFEPGALIGLRGTDVTTPEIAAYTLEIEQRVRKTGKSISTEQTYPLPDGSMIEVIATRFPVPDDEGHMTNVGCIMLNLTQQKEAEVAMRISEARFAAFMSNAPIGMYLKDEDGTIIMANAEMKEAFPDDSETCLQDRIGHNVADFLDAKTVALIAEQEAQAIAKDGTQTDEWHRPHLSRYAWAATVRFPVHVDGAPTQVGGFIIDLTARKNAELALVKSNEALHQSEKLNALGSLLAGVSHELNNPLSAVIGQTMMLEEDAVGTAFAARAERIRVAAERCARIVEIFLAMARQKPPTRAPVQINDVVFSALELLSYGLRSSGVVTHRDLASGIPMIQADADQLHQVLVNLIVNAQQALESWPEPRNLTIATRSGSGGNTIELEVRDNGPGIPAAAARRIFEPFFTTKPAGSGTGIGLSFSLGVVEANGGQLRLLDVAEGASFVIELPIETAGVPTAPEGVSAREATARGRALIVDDDDSVAEALCELVQREGYGVERADSGVSALACLTRSDYDLILTDLRMPQMDGPALFAWIVRERAHLVERVGFLTGDVLSASAAEFLAGAARPYCEKPFTPASVRALIADIMASTSTH